MSQVERRVRPGRPSSLTHERIVETALGLVGSRRLEDVSMRELAGELGVSVMTLYNYVANKDELNTLAIDFVLRDVEIPPPDSGDWRHRMRRLMVDARAAMARHRGVSLRNGPRSAEAARLAEGVLAILAASGYDEDAAARAFTLLYTFMLGQVQVDAFTDPGHGAGEPTLQSVTDQADATTDELFEFSFDAVIAGLEATLGAPGSARRSPLTAATGARSAKARPSRRR